MYNLCSAVQTARVHVHPMHYSHPPSDESESGTDVRVLENDSVTGDAVRGEEGEEVRSDGRQSSSQDGTDGGGERRREQASRDSLPSCEAGVY